MFKAGQSLTLMSILRSQASTGREHLMGMHVGKDSHCPADTPASAAGLTHLLISGNNWSFARMFKVTSLRSLQLDGICYRAAVNQKMLALSFATFLRRLSISCSSAYDHELAPLKALVNLQLLDISATRIRGTARAVNSSFFETQDKVFGTNQTGRLFVRFRPLPYQRVFTF